METKQIIKPIDINKIAGEIERQGNLEMYWDYNDKLTDEQVLKILTEEEGLSEVENEIYEGNYDYISEQVDNSIKGYFSENNLDFEEFQETEDYQELCTNLRCEYKFNINGLLKNSETRIRLELSTNEDFINLDDKNSDTIRYFKERFKGHFKVKDLKEEINEMIGSNYARITFYFKISGLDILDLRKQILDGRIKLKKGLSFGLFNSYSGCGGMLEIPLLKKITLNIKDWRVKDERDKVMKKLKGDSDYYNIEFVCDSKSYGIDETYGLVGEAWKEWR